MATPGARASTLGKGHKLEIQTKEAICNAYDYFVKQSKKGGQSVGPRKQTAEAIKISEKCVQKVLKERENGFQPPAKRFKVSRKKIVVDRFGWDAIRHKIYEMYSRKEHITLDKLLPILRDADLFDGKRTVLREILKDMGFNYKKIDNRRHYFEQPRIVQQRHTYLRRMMQNRADRRSVVYLDETWANSHDGKNLAWVEDDEGTLGGVKRPSGKGTSIIILGAGGEMGWVANTTLIFQSKRNTGDYHDEMTGEHFEEWFRDTLLPNVPPHGLIVMDNVSYHTRRLEEVPVKSWTKKRMVAWLEERNISFDPKAKKPEIFSIAQGLGATPKYISDEMALAASHEVVRLPVAHCVLNPIELAWLQVKGYVKANNRRFNLDEVKRLAKEGFEVVTPERWTSLVKHVRDKVEDHYWRVDGLARTYTVPEFTIHIGTDDDDSSEEESSSEGETASDPDSNSGNPMADND